MNIILGSTPVLLRTMFFVLSCMGAQQAFAQELADHQYTSEAITTGLRIYTQQCSLCHGPQGDLVDGINLRTGQFRDAQTDDDLMLAIREGLADGRMPAFNLSADELNGLIAFIRAGFEPNYEEVIIGDAERGKLLFEGEGKCAECHRVGGVGPRIAPDLSSIALTLTPATLQQNLLDPASVLLPINRQVRIVTLDEETIVGRRLNEDTYTIQLIDSQERLRSVRKSEIATYTISEAPSKEPTTLSEDEVADVIAYLLTLRGL